jgi:hypothetical protein
MYDKINYIYYIMYISKTKFLDAPFGRPYHSETNPIERVFSVLKNEINRNENDSIEDIIKSILNVKNTITKSNPHINKYLQSFI